MMFWYDHNMGWWGYAGMAIGMVLFWVLLLVGIVALIRFIAGDRQSTYPTPTPTPTPSPEQILADRFARGEISETEYRDRLTVLQNSRGR